MGSKINPGRYVKRRQIKANKPLQLTATGLIGDGGAPVATIVSNL